MKRIEDIFSKEKFQQELAEEISKDFKKSLTNSPANNRHK